MDVSENIGTPESSHFNRVFHYKPYILGYPYFWKHPYIYIYIYKYVQKAQLVNLTFAFTRSIAKVVK